MMFEELETDGTFEEIANKQARQIKGLIISNLYNEGYEKPEFACLKYKCNIFKIRYDDYTSHHDVIDKFVDLIEEFESRK